MNWTVYEHVGGPLCGMIVHLPEDVEYLEARREPGISSEPSYWAVRTPTGKALLVWRLGAPDYDAHADP